MQVSIILHDLDRDIVSQLVQQGPIWLRQSAINTGIAASLWKQSFDPDHVTTFIAPEGADTERSALYILDTVLQHHPDWTRLFFIGLKNGASIRAELETDYPCKLSEIPDGIVVTR